MWTFSPNQSLITLLFSHCRFQAAHVFGIQFIFLCFGVWFPFPYFFLLVLWFQKNGMGVRYTFFGGGVLILGAKHPFYSPKKSPKSSLVRCNKPVQRLHCFIYFIFSMTLNFKLAKLCLWNYLSYFWFLIRFFFIVRSCYTYSFSTFKKKKIKQQKWPSKWILFTYARRFYIVDRSVSHVIFHKRERNA